MNDPELSIIVPVYNVEEYLEDCVQSILTQTYQDYEIILIDDGSTDNSGRICDSFTDERIRVFHKENGGLSSARNVGLEHAKGQFITFIDSDDQYGDIETLSENMRIMRDFPDIDFLQFPYTTQKNGETISTHAPKERLLYDSDIFKELYRGFDALTYNVWNKIYRKDVIGNLRFIEGKTAEDAFFHLDLLPKIHCTYISNRGSYLYSIREGSITCSSRDSDTRKKFKKDQLNILSIYYLEAAKYPSLTIHRLESLIGIMMEYMLLRREYPQWDYSECRNRLFSHKLSFGEVFNFTRRSEACKRFKIHAWAYYLLRDHYDSVYLWILKKNTSHKKILICKLSILTSCT